MGMVYVLRRVTDAQLNMLLARPLLIEHFLFDEPRQSAVAKTGLLDKLIETFGFTRSMSPIDKVREEGDEIDLDKSWHGMHFVLTGSAAATGTPLSFLIEEWPEIGDIDVGYGPAKAINSAAVARFSDALAKFSPVQLRSTYQPDQMLAEQIYLDDFFADNIEEGIEYLEYWLNELQKFVKECVARKAGVVTYLN